MAGQTVNIFFLLKSQSVQTRMNSDQYLHVWPMSHFGEAVHIWVKHFKTHLFVHPSGAKKITEYIVLLFTLKSCSPHMTQTNQEVFLHIN